MNEEINSRVNSGNACYHSVQSLLSSRLLSRNVKIEIYKTIILPVVLYGCETWSLTLREEHRLRVFANRVLKRIFGPKRNDVTGEWRKLHNEELHNFYSSQNIIRHMKSRRVSWTGHMVHMGEERKCTRFWWESLRERDHSEGQGVVGRMGSEWTLGKLAGGVDWILAGGCGLDSTG
jgi:hypothetical protein